MPALVFSIFMICLLVVSSLAAIAYLFPNSPSQD